MGYPVRLQKVDRPTNRSYYVNLPVAVAEAIEAEKGEVLEWTVEDRNTLMLRRQRLRKIRQPSN
jgi:antitoxin component of MazEF toxin-antitoxin module